MRGRPAQVSALRTALGVIWLIALILFLVYLAISLAALLWISPLIVDGIIGGTCPEGLDCRGFFFWINPLNPNFLEVIRLGGTGLLTWFFIVLTVIFGIVLYLALFYARRTYRDIRLPPERVDEKLASRSPIVAVGQVFMAILFFDTVYLLIILPLLGVVPEVPQIDPEWYFLYIVVNATVWEELAFRVLLIGLPMVLASMVTRLSDVVSGQRVQGEGRGRYLAGPFKYLLGGHVREGSPRSAIIVGAALVFVSAIIFGYLHVPGSGAWRFVLAFVSGLAMGYLFLRYGIVASILFHFSINSLGVLGGVAVASLGSALFVGLLYWALVAFGAGFFAYYTKRVGGFLLRPFPRPRRRPAPAPRSNPRPTNPGGELLLFPVTCPECGGHEAEYQDGALVCSQCGTRISTPGPDRGGSEVLD